MVVTVLFCCAFQSDCCNFLYGRNFIHENLSRGSFARWTWFSTANVEGRSTRIDRPRRRWWWIPETDVGFQKDAHSEWCYRLNHEQVKESCQLSACAFYSENCSFFLWLCSRAFYLITIGYNFIVYSTLLSQAAVVVFFTGLGEGGLQASILVCQYFSSLLPLYLVRFKASSSCFEIAERSILKCLVRQWKFYSNLTHVIVDRSMKQILEEMHIITIRTLSSC